MQGRLVVLPDGSERRAYTAVEAANALGITAKTLVAWTDATRRGGARLDGWAPRSVDPAEHRWLVDADALDRIVAERTPAIPAPAMDERTRLDEERHLFEMERALFASERVQQLEEDNARLRDDVARLRRQLAALGDVVRTLTAPAT